MTKQNKCSHKRKQIGELNLKTGMANCKCLDCGQDLGEVPAAHWKIMEVCLQQKNNAHYPTKPAELKLWGKLKLDKAW